MSPKEVSHNKGYLEEAKKAYEDIITGVYGSGLGDQDVLLLDASTDGSTYTSPNPTIRPGQGALVLLFLSPINLCNSISHFLYSTVLGGGSNTLPLFFLSKNIIMSLF